jgi:hypothetical protein
MHQAFFEFGRNGGLSPCRETYHRNIQSAIFHGIHFLTLQSVLTFFPSLLIGIL